MPDHRAAIMSSVHEGTTTIPDVKWSAGAIEALNEKHPWLQLPVPESTPDTPDCKLAKRSAIEMSGQLPTPDCKLAKHTRASQDTSFWAEKLENLKQLQAKIESQSLSSEDEAEADEEFWRKIDEGSSVDEAEDEVDEGSSVDEAGAAVAGKDAPVAAGTEGGEGSLVDEAEAETVEDEGEDAPVPETEAAPSNEYQETQRKMRQKKVGDEKEESVGDEKVGKAEELAMSRNRMYDEWMEESQT